MKTTRRTAGTPSMPCADGGLHRRKGGLTTLLNKIQPNATWCDRNVYALLLTFAGGTVLHQTKKISLIVDSSMETEAIAS